MVFCNYLILMEYPLLRRFRFLYKLLIAFLITGVLPVSLLSMSFALLSGGIVRGSYRQQAQTTLRGISEDLNITLEKYRHIIYSLSEDEQIAAAIQSGRTYLRSERLELYQKIYTALTGHIDDASLHIISLTGFPSFSTQQIPSSYLRADDEAGGGIFTLSRRQPEKTVAVFNSFINERGDLIMMTLCRAIRNQDGEIIGFALLDITKQSVSSTCEEKNRDVFSQMFFVDPRNNLVSDLNHSDNDGNFSRLPFLSRIPEEGPGLFSDENRMVVYTPLTITPFQLTGTVPLNVVLSHLDKLIRITLWLLLFCIVLAVVLAVLVSRSISMPVHSLTLAMGRVEEGDLSVRIPVDRDDEIGLLFRRFNLMTGRIETLMAETREEQEQLRVAERKALQAQINPHFLYNTLNTIKSIAKLEGIDKITTIVTQLGKLLRNSIEIGRETVSLSESLDLVESYLAIQKIRFGERLSYLISADPEILQTTVPKLIIQPLVENAVIHGLEPGMENGMITVRACREEDRLIIRIEDDGVGMESPWTPGETAGPQGVGLSNVHRRLELLYGAPCGLSVDSVPGSGTTVTLTLPLIEEEKE